MPGLILASRPIRYERTPVERGDVLAEAALVVVDLLHSRAIGELEQDNVADHAISLAGSTACVATGGGAIQGCTGGCSVAA